MALTQPTLTVPPTTTLGSLSELKAYGGIEENTHDAVLLKRLQSESETVEGENNQCWRPQTWLQTETCFRPYMRLSKAPLASVSVAYYNSSNVLTTWATTEYELQVYPFPAIVLAYNKSLPETYQRLDAVRITLVCGGTVPERVKELCFARVLGSHEIREAITTGNVVENPQFERLTRQLRRAPYFA